MNTLMLAFGTCVAAAGLIGLLAGIILGCWACLTGQIKVSRTSEEPLGRVTARNLQLRA